MSTTEPPRTEPYNRREQAGRISQLVGYSQALMIPILLVIMWLDSRSPHHSMMLTVTAVVLGVLVLVSSVIFVVKGRALERNENSIKANAVWLVLASALAAACTVKYLGVGTIMYIAVVALIYGTYLRSHEK